jgi:SAM-dependent methyltransferase
MTVDAVRARARELARESLERGDPVGWFEPLYAEANGDPSAIQWADLRPNPHLAAWLDRQDAPSLAGKRALVIGSGLGDDAEDLARRGCDVTAFDISPTAIAWTARRFPGSSVSYTVADLLAPPDGWIGAFDLVVEVYTLQVLPPDARRIAAERIVSLVAPGGALLVVARGRDPEDPEGAMPWPLTRDDLGCFVAVGLTEIRFEDFDDPEDPGVRRFRVEYRAPEA